MSLNSYIQSAKQTQIVDALDSVKSIVVYEDILQDLTTLRIDLLSDNRNITWDIIKNNLDKKWNWYNITKYISWDIIQANPELPWCCGTLCAFPELTWEFVKYNIKHVKKNMKNMKNMNNIQTIIDMPGIGRY